MKINTLTILATSSLIIMLSALFFPLLCGMFIFGVITVSVWEASHLVALLGIVAIGACTLMPLFRPGAKAWLLPFLLGSAIFVAVLSATTYSFSDTDLSNGFFHPYGLIIFSVGGVLCMAEGLVARTRARLTTFGGG